MKKEYNNNLIFDNLEDADAEVISLFVARTDGLHFGAADN